MPMNLVKVMRIKSLTDDKPKVHWNEKGIMVIQTAIELPNTPLGRVIKGAIRTDGLNDFVDALNLPPLPFLLRQSHGRWKVVATPEVWRHAGGLKSLVRNAPAERWFHAWKQAALEATNLDKYDV